MALRTQEVLDVHKVLRAGDKCEIGITNGPDDEDLSFCLRRIIGQITFYLDQPVLVSGHFNDPNTFFYGGIVALRAISETAGGRNHEWEIEGEARKGVFFACRFRCTYNSQTRKGTVQFL